MRVWRRICGVAAVLALAAPVGMADERRLLDRGEAESFGGVGRLNIAGNRFCTATLIAPDLALTAAHCLYHPRSKRVVPLSQLRFVAGLRFGQHRGWRRVVEAAVPEGYVYDGDARFTTMRDDIALLRLESPLDTTVIPTGARGDGDEGLTIVSYSRDRAHAASIETGCGVRGQAGPVAAIDCTVSHGASGAPVILGEGAERRVVAVVSAIARGHGGRALAVTVGPGLDALRRELAGGRTAMSPRG